MSSISLQKKSNKGKMIDKTDLMDIDGFLMASSRKIFRVKGCEVREIKIVDKKLANPVVSKKVFKKYDKLIEHLTELLVDDDDSGDSLREALNQIEKFRLEIKIKYRKFLKKKELEKMSKKLKFLQKQAMTRLMEMQNYYYEEAKNQNNRSR